MLSAILENYRNKITGQKVRNFLGLDRSSCIFNNVVVTSIIKTTKFFSSGYYNTHQAITIKNQYKISIAIKKMCQ